MEGLPALIMEGNPSDKFQHVALGRRHHVITCLPVHACGDVTELRGSRARLICLQLPRQYGLKDGVVGKPWKYRLAGQCKLQFAVYFNKGLLATTRCDPSLLWVVLLAIAEIGGIGRDIAAADDLALYHARIRVFVRLDKINGPAFI